MRIARLGIAVFTMVPAAARWVALTAFLSTVALSGDDRPLIEAVHRPVSPTMGGRYFERDRYVLRYRYVIVNIDTLNAYLFKLEGLASDELAESGGFVLSLFPDFEIIAFPVEITAHGGKFVIPSDTESLDSEHIGEANLRIGPHGRLMAYIDVIGRRYVIQPTDQLPYHIVVEADPDNLPPID